MDNRLIFLMYFNNKMNLVTKKFCSCLTKVGRKVENPYGICTKSVYSTRGLKRKGRVSCAHTKTLPELRRYAKTKNIKLTKNGKYLTKKDLLKKLFQKNRSRM